MRAFPATRRMTFAPLIKSNPEKRLKLFLNTSRARHLLNNATD